MGCAGIGRVDGVYRKMDPSLEESDRWRRFDRYIDHQKRHFVRGPKEGGPYHCPCCGYRTLEERGTSEICEVCYWEDDGQDDEDAEIVRGGPNGALSLAQARANYRAFGACEQSMLENVRPPRSEELT
jgi:hypothetical protein